jgi:hypothetical protein
MTRSPYTGLPGRHFWKTGVGEQHPLLISDIYRKKFDIPATAAIATAGSCFAQHVAVHLRESGYNVMDMEPPPMGLSVEHAREHGYLLYSARFGNVYTVRQLLNLTQEAFGKLKVNDGIWTRDGRFFDALRPSVEPEGLDSEEELKAHRRRHVRRVRKMFEEAGVFIFTMGLTEAWVSRESGTVFPTAPGTIAGSYDPEKFRLKNFTYEEIRADFLAFRNIVREVNPGLRFILTVSPVPLTATATDDHVLVATMHAKSVLRAVAGTLAHECADIDYFPSYEIIASHFSRGFFYDANLRTVSRAGVENVMRIFFQPTCQTGSRQA